MTSRVREYSAVAGARTRADAIQSQSLRIASSNYLQLRFVILILLRAGSS